MHEAQRKSPDIINNWSIWGCTMVQSTNDQKARCGTENNSWTLNTMIQCIWHSYTFSVSKH